MAEKQAELAATIANPARNTAKWAAVFKLDRPLQMDPARRKTAWEA